MDQLREMKKKSLISLMISILLLSLGACAPGNQNPTPADTSLANTNWELISFGPPGGEKQVIEGTNVTLEFGSGVMAGGFGGCNTFGARYEVLENNQISIDEIIATEIACTGEGVMDQEIQYFEALLSASRYEIAGDKLTIWYGDRQSTLNFSRLTSSPPVPVTPSSGS